MPRKRDNDGPRGRGSRIDFMNAVRSGERALFVTISKVIVVMLFLLFAVISVAESSVLVAALAGVGVFITAAVLLPIDRIRAGLNWFSSGKAGTWIHNRYLGLMPGRSPDDNRGRGQTELSKLLALCAVVLLVSSLFATGIGAAAVQEDTDSESTQNCTEVVHDGYLTDDSYIGEFNDTAKIESTDRNVRTSLEETDVFVRLQAENPNSYCVDMTVKIHPDIIPPAEVGDLTATDGETESTWRNTHDFESDQRYTEITFQLGAGEEVTFAPNRLRVHSLAWKDQQTDPSGFVEKITSRLDGGDLDKRVYKLNSSEGSIVTVPLEDDDGQTINEWQAAYRVGDGRWRPITTDSDDPVFYKETDNGDAVQFHFDTDNYDAGEVEVEFTANPNMLDKRKHDYRSYTASWSDLFNFNFDIISITGATAELPIAEVAR